MEDVVAVVAGAFEKRGLGLGEAGEDVVVEGDGIGGIEGMGENETVCWALGSAMGIKGKRHHRYRIATQWVFEKRTDKEKRPKINAQDRAEETI